MQQFIEIAFAVLAGGFLMGYLLAKLHYWAIGERERRKNPFPSKYDLVSCDCDHAMQCPQGKSPTAPRCQIWKGVYDA